MIKFTFMFIVTSMAIGATTVAIAQEEAPPVPVESDAEACSVHGEVHVSNRGEWRQARRDWRANRPRRSRGNGGSAGSTGSYRQNHTYSHSYTHSYSGGSAGSTGSFSGGYGNVANRSFSDAKLPVLGLPIRATAKVRQNRFARIDSRRGW